MNTTTPSTRQRVRIYTHMTQSRFLHVEDALSIGKLRLFAGNYRKNQGMDSHNHHFIDIDDARVIFTALANGEQGYTHREYKGSPGKAAKDDPISRVLAVAIKGNKAYVELKTGPGKLTATGAITPGGKATSETNVVFDLPQARRLGQAVTAYLHTWEIMRMMQFRHVVGQPLRYELVSASNDAALTEAVTLYSIEDMVEANSATPDETRRPQTNGATAPLTDTRPVTNRHLAALRYSNGKQIGDTSAERNAFQQFQKTKGRVPRTPDELRAFVQTGTAV